MEKITCSACGSDTASDGACAGCGKAARNGAAERKWLKPPPPPEVANWVITPTPPEMLEQMRREFNEAEYLAAARELERTGGVAIDDLLKEFEREAHGGS